MLSDPVVEARLAAYPLRQVGGAERAVSYREAGAGMPLVLLHGIGSSSASWVPVFERLASRFRLIAWDAPGYGRSANLPATAPTAEDYADVLAALLDQLGCERPVLVGHSLGALIAASFAAARPDRLCGLVLANPAPGYGAAEPELRQRKLADRLADMEALGPAGLARQRAPRLLSAQARPDALALVQWSMQALLPKGYEQAARMLAGACLMDAAARYPGPLLVLGSGGDTITPEAGARAVAAACRGAEYRGLGTAGHASYIEAPDAFADAVAAFASRALRS